MRRVVEDVRIKHIIVRASKYTLYLILLSSSIIWCCVEAMIPPKIPSPDREEIKKIPVITTKLPQGALSQSAQPAAEPSAILYWPLLAPRPEEKGGPYSRTLAYVTGDKATRPAWKVQPAFMIGLRGGVRAHECNA